MAAKTTCPRCYGQGQHYDAAFPFHVECLRCEGTGRVPATSVTVHEDLRLVKARTLIIVPDPDPVDGSEPLDEWRRRHD